ncbi:MAG: hypothetical protein AABX65_00295 [Nanoarchaeota archaeon]|mgnify:CR=1 FL=1
MALEAKVSQKLSYEELAFPNYINTHTALSLPAKVRGEDKIIEVPFSDIPKACVLGGINFLNIGYTRGGKSQMMMDILRGYFNGDTETCPNGRGNLLYGRNEFTADAYFMDINQEEIGEGQGLLSKARVQNEKRIRALCTTLDELNLCISQKQVEYFMIGEGRHQGISLGEEEYHLLMSACNLDRINGDFAGTSEINKALLNRFGVTLDHDFFAPTEADRNKFEMAKQTGKLKLAPLRDLSPQILEAYREISQRTRSFNPLFAAYSRFISSGLEYCEKDADKRKKKIWPSNCASCDFPNKDLCSLVKHSPTGTIEAVKRFATSMAYLIELKHGSEVVVDPFDLMLESYKFTTYHGALNSLLTISDFSGEDQEQMNKAVFELRKAVAPIKHYLEESILLAERESAVSTNFCRIRKPDGSEVVFPENGSVHARLKETNEGLAKIAKNKKISYETFNPFENLAQSTGLSINWLPSFLEFVRDYYQAQKSEEIK